MGDCAVGVSGEDKTSLLVSAPNVAGSLYRLLQPFAENQVSMTRIESRPSHGVNWEYVFFLDLQGHCEDTPLQKALSELKQSTDMVKVLGSYPKAVI